MGSEDLAQSNGEVTAYFRQVLLWAAILLFTAISRFSAQISQGLRHFIERNTRKYLIVMGAVHVMTNMGGSFIRYPTSA